MNIALYNILCRAGSLCYLLVGIAVLCARLSYAQQENVWVFGHNAGVDFNGPVPVGIVANIGTDPPIFGEAAASVCDNSGNLLFYTEGSFVYDRQHNLMPNGNNLTGLMGANGYTPTTSTSQGALIAPMPDQPDKYYIFSLTSAEQASQSGYLYYSVVDMSLNGGLGDVVIGQKGIILDFGLTEQMTAIAGNDCNIWLLVISRTANQLRAFEITSSGVSPTPALSNITGMNFIAPEACMASSPDGTKIAITGYTYLYLPPAYGLTLFDFDPASGTANNQKSLHPGSAHGVCFSPDNTKLYCSVLGVDGLVQYDLSLGTLPNIIASKTTIAEGGFIHLKLGPDNKLYFRGGPGLSVINFPDQPGLACQYQADAVSLAPGTSMHSGLPNAVPVIRQYDTITTKTTIERCEGYPLTLGPNDTSGWGYIWSDGLTEVTRSVMESASYYVSYNLPSCEYHTDTFVVTMLPSSSMKISEKICAGEQYDFNGIQLTETGTYHDTLVAANGCDSTVTLDLVVLPLPEMSISVGQHTIPLCIGDTILCEASGAANYLWFNNDRLIDDSSHQAYIYLPHLSNSIMVIGRDNGCLDTAKVVINVEACCDIFIPNAFSPNGDGLNDGFAPVPYGNVWRYQMRIFNRWGQQVFSAFTIDNRWDGTYNGAPADVGTYFYSISADCMEGTELIRKGEVILVR